MNQPVFEVQEIIDSAIINYEPHYLIKWKNYDHSNDTWEPISQLGSISKFIKHWMDQRRKAKETAQRQKQKSVYSNIKPFLNSDSVRPPKKTNRQKYAEEILKKKKTWEKYFELEDNQEYDQKVENKAETFQKSQVNSLPVKMEQSIPKNITQTQQIKEQISLPENNVTKMQPENVEKQKQEVKVVGSIRTTSISKILKLFTFKGIQCVELELSSGRHCNMKVQQLKKHNPLLLSDYLQQNGIPF